MSDIENIEIRVCLIGDESCGKKSIISRFKMLNSSQTIQGSKNNLPERNGLKEIATNKSLGDTFFSNKYDASTKKKIKSLINFSKVLTISNFNLEFKFFPISSADKIEINDNLNEIDETLRQHKMKFDNIKSEIEKVIMKQPRLPSAEVKLLLMFIIDLKNFDRSFEKIKIYHDSLNKYLNIDKNHFKVLIGNKVDVKDNNLDRHVIDEYAVKNRFIYNEISCKMFFNFEKFFEKLFFDSFEKINSGFATKYFKERFNYVMSFRPTFTRAERTNSKMDDVPGPQKYDSNVFNFEEAKPVFGKQRFKNKIFVNKTGPVFDYKKENFMTNKSRQKLEKKTKKTQKKNLRIEEKEDYELSEKKKKLKDDMFGHNPGFTMGIKPSIIKFREHRKEEYREMMRSFDDIFDLDNILSKNKRKEPRQMSAGSDRLNLKKKKGTSNKIRKLLKEKTQNNIKGLKLEEAISKAKTSKANLSDSEKDKTKVSKFASAASNKAIKRAKSHKLTKVEKFEVPGPASYDIRGKVDISRGYTFGGKYNLNSKNNYAPGYLYLESDIEFMMKQPKFAY